MFAGQSIITIFFKFDAKNISVYNVKPVRVYLHNSKQKNFPLFMSISTKSNTMFLVRYYIVSTLLRWRRIRTVKVFRCFTFVKLLSPNRNVLFELLSSNTNCNLPTLSDWQKSVNLAKQKLIL